MINNEPTNFYKVIPKKLLPKYHNPQYEKTHLFKIPMRTLIVGGSGSGKTTLVLEIIKRMNDTFSLIILVCKNAQEPLYIYLKSKIPEEQLLIVEYQDKEQIPDLEYLDKKYKGEQILTIFDDLILEKDQSIIEQYFNRGRKIAGGISILYLTQNYFKTSKHIRINCNYIILKKLQSTRDLNIILSDFNLGVDRKELLEIYKYSTDTQLSFLLIDIDAKPEDRFLKNFSEKLKIENF